MNQSIGNHKILDAARPLCLYLIAFVNLFGVGENAVIAPVFIYLSGCGFLAALMLAEEHYRNGGFNLLIFLKRRFTRLYPPLFFCVLITLCAAIVIKGDYTILMLRGAASALSFTSNLHETAYAYEYTSRHIPPLFSNLRLISSEMQMYALWACICALLSAASRGFYDIRKRARFFRISAAAAAAVLFIISVIYIISRGGASAQSIMNYPLCAMLPFAMGACIAAVLCINERFVISMVLSVDSKTLGGAVLNMAPAFYILHLPIYFISAQVINSGAAGFAAVLTALLAVALYFGFESVLRPERRPKNMRFRDYKRKKRKNRIIRTGALSVLCVLSLFSAAIKKPQFTTLESGITGLYVMEDVFALKAERAKAEAFVTDFVNYGEQDAYYFRLSASQTAAPERGQNVRAAEEETLENVSVTIIGDSVTLGAYQALTNAFDDVYIDAKVSRRIDAGLDITREMRRNGTLGDVVVIALGTNVDFEYASKLMLFIDELEPGKRLVFVTPYNGGSDYNAQYAQDTAVWERGLPGAYDYVTLADWNAVISQTPNILSKDGIHINNAAAAQMFAECVSAAVTEALSRPAKEG